MPDMDVIVKSLRRCSDMTICPVDCCYRKYAPDCVAKLHRDAINLLKEQNELLKQQDELLEVKDERIKNLEHKLKEQEKKQITFQKKHVITWNRNDGFSMRKLYEAICETLLDEGELFIARTDNHEKVEIVFYVAEGR